MKTNLIRIAAGVAAGGALLLASIPAFAAASPNASCVGADFSVEGPKGRVVGEVKEFQEFARGLGVPFGSLVKGFAQVHGTRADCGE